MKHADFWIWDRDKKHTLVGRYDAECTCQKKSHFLTKRSFKK